MKKKPTNVGQNALRVVRRFFPKVQSVHDATRDLIIDVTDADSKSATKKDHNHCALAVACEKKMHADGVIISLSTAYVVKDNVATRFKVTEPIAREIVSFDRQGGFEPGSYRLKRPPESSRIGAYKGPGGPHTKKKVNTAHATTNVRTSLIEPDKHK